MSFVCSYIAVLAEPFKKRRLEQQVKDGYHFSSLTVKSVPPRGLGVNVMR